MENINVASLLLTVPGNSDLNIISTDNDNNENNQFNPDKIKYYPIVEPPGQSMALTLYEYILKKHPPTWSKFFLSAELEIRHACEMINKTSIKTGKSILPIMTDVLAAFWIFPLFLLKVKIHILDLLKMGCQKHAVFHSHVEKNIQCQPH